MSYGTTAQVVVVYSCTALLLVGYAGTLIWYGGALLAIVRGRRAGITVIPEIENSTAAGLSCSANLGGEEEGRNDKNADEDEDDESERRDDGREDLTSTTNECSSDHESTTFLQESGGVARKCVTEKCIMATAFLGCIELLFWSAMYLFDASNPSEQVSCRGYYHSLAVAGILFGVLKGGLSRCMYVLVCSGLGFACASLGRTRCVVVAILGLAFVVAACARDAIGLYFFQAIFVLSPEKDNEVMQEGASVALIVGKLFPIFFSPRLQKPNRLNLIPYSFASRWNQPLPI